MTNPTATTAPDVDLRIAVAAAFIDALVVRDFDALTGTLTEDVHFRALLPSRNLDLEGPEAVQAMFVQWFGGSETWEMEEAVVGEVGGRVHLRWRVRLTNPEKGPGTFLVEQQAYADPVADGRLGHLSLLCTGYRPAS